MRYFSLIVTSVLLLGCLTARADLIGYWTFNDGTTKDSSGNGYGAETLGSGITFVDGGKVSKSVQGTGLGKVNCDFGAANIPANNITVSFWGEMAGTSWNDYACMYANGDIQFQRNGSAKSVSVYDGPNPLNCSKDLSSGFHHIALSCDASTATATATLYVDGAAIQTVDWNRADKVTALTLLGRYIDGNRRATGKIDEVQVYNAPLSAEKIAYLYNNPTLYAASEYSRNVTAAGNWTDSAWTTGGQDNQLWANSSAVTLTASGAPTLTVDANIMVNSLDFTSGSMTLAGTNSVSFNGEKRVNVVNAADTITISAPVAAGFVKTGAGTLALTNAGNTPAGGVEIQGGKVTANSTGALGWAKITLNGGTLDVSSAGAKTFNNAITVGEGGGTLVAAGSEYSPFASISGTGALETKGLLRFNGTGGYSGNITVTNGYVRVAPGAVGFIPSLEIKANANFNMEGAGTLKIKTLTGAGALFAATGVGYTFEIGEGTLASEKNTFSGAIRGSGTTNSLTLKKVGAGELYLNRGSELTGGYKSSIKEIIVESGTLTFAGVNSTMTWNSTENFHANAPITVKTGGILQVEKAWNISPNVPLTLDGGTLRVGDTQYANRIDLKNARIENYNSSSEPVRVGLTGAPVWNVTGGESTIATSVSLIKSGTFDTFTLKIDKDATLQMTNTFIADTDTYKGMNMLVTGGPNGAGTLKLDGTKQITTNGNWTFDGVTVETGGSHEFFPFFKEGTVTLQNGAVFKNTTDHATNWTPFILDDAELNNTANSYISDITLKNGSSMTGQINYGYSFDGTIQTRYDEGAAKDVMNTVTANLRSINTGAAHTLTLAVAEFAPLTISGKIYKESGGDTFSVTKTGDGLLILTNAQNTMAAGLTVQDGTLRLTQTGANGTGVLTVAPDGTLEIGAPDTPTEITFTNDVTLGGTLALDYFTTTSFDMVHFGDVTFGENSTLYVDLHGADSSESQKIALFDSENLAGTFKTVLLSDPNWAGEYKGGTFVIYDKTSVPEPSAWLLLALGAVGLWWRRKAASVAIQLLSHGFAND